MAGKDFDFSQLNDIDFSGLDTEPVVEPTAEVQQIDAATQANTALQTWLDGIPEQGHAYEEQSGIHPTMAMIFFVDERTNKSYHMHFNMDAVDKVGWLNILAHRILG